MTKEPGIVQFHRVATSKGEFLGKLAERYRYSEPGTIKRPADKGLLADVISCADGGIYYHTGFSDDGILSIPPAGHHKYQLPLDTVGVVPQVLTSSPVSGLVFVYQMHQGKRPWVIVDVACSGVHMLMHLATATKEPAERSSAGVHRKSVVAEPPKPTPSRCTYCGGQAIHHEDQLGTFVCFTCGKSQPRA